MAAPGVALGTNEGGWDMGGHQEGPHRGGVVPKRDTGGFWGCHSPGTAGISVSGGSWGDREGSEGGWGWEGQEGTQSGDTEGHGWHKG